MTLFPFAEYWTFYMGFILLVMTILALDLGIFHKDAHEVSFKEASLWTTVWISIALVFNVLFSLVCFSLLLGLKCFLQELKSRILKIISLLDNLKKYFEYIHLLKKIIFFGKKMA